MAEPSNTPLPGQEPGLFVTTHWSVVLAAGVDESSVARNALEQLCRTYWYPLYVYARRRGYDVEEAKDLTQEFFARLIAKNSLGDVVQGRGRFRYYLLAALKHFLADEWDKTTARKRGGGFTFIPLDGLDPEERYHLEPRDEVTPEIAFQRRWALTLLDLALSRLREEFQLAGKERLFDGLKMFITGDKPETSYAETAATLGMTEAAAKMTVTRMRQRYRTLLRAEIANTVVDPKEVDAELRELAALLRTSP
jgi:RNA polymerase sigma factor (sigma-70 family)